MNRYITWYGVGIWLIIAAVFVAELIWLPAPIASIFHMQWIEYVNAAFYSLSIIPLCWLIGSLLSWNTDLSKLHRLLAIVISLLSTILIVLIWLYSKQFLMMLMTLGLLLISIVVDMIWCEMKQLSNEKGGSSFRRKWPTVFIRRLSYVFVCFVLLLCPTSYQVTYPGLTMNMNKYAHIANEHASGTIDGVLIYERIAVPMDFVYSMLFPQYELQKRSVGEPSISETYTQVVRMKEDADQLAAAIAMEYAGLGSGITYKGVFIQAITAQSPADGLLEAGDIIVGINQARIRQLSDLSTYMIDNVRPGDEVNVHVIRHSKQISLKVNTVQAQDNHRAVLGIAVENAYELNTNLPIAYTSYITHAGGPSHGAMLTLALYDQLTEGDATKGLHIAGTGTINLDGSIGMVGGIPQKAYTVSRTGADVFFVPAQGFALAKAGASNLNIVAVEHFTDILSWIEEHAPQ